MFSSIVCCNSVNLFRVLFSPSPPVAPPALPTAEADPEMGDASGPPTGMLSELAASSDDILVIESARARGELEAMASKHQYA